MWNEPNKGRLENIPRLYETEDIPLEAKMVYLHFFIGKSHWYIFEFDGEDLFFGFAILGGDYQNAECGYISFKELKEVKAFGWLEVDCELEDYFPVQSAIEVENIRLALQYKGWVNHDSEAAGNQSEAINVS